MKQAYTIQLNTCEDIAILIVSIEKGIKGFERQLSENKGFEGRPLSADERLTTERICNEMRRMYVHLIEELPRFDEGQDLAKSSCNIKMGGGTATIVYALLRLALQTFERNLVEDKTGGKEELVRRSRERVIGLLAQLPFNEKKFEGGFFFSDVHQERSAQEVKIADVGKVTEDIVVPEDPVAFEAFYKEHKEVAQKWMDEHPEKKKALRKAIFRHHFHWFHYPRAIAGIALTLAARIWIIFELWQTKSDFIIDRHPLKPSNTLLVVHCLARVPALTELVY
jgi:hypothetical protein